MRSKITHAGLLTGLNLPPSISTIAVLLSYLRISSVPGARITERRLTHPRWVYQKENSLRTFFRQIDHYAKEVYGIGPTEVYPPLVKRRSKNSFRLNHPKVQRSLFKPPLLERSVPDGEKDFRFRNLTQVRVTLMLATVRQVASSCAFLTRSRDEWR